MPSEYEQRRLKNIEDNKRILKILGLLNPYKPLPRVLQQTVKTKRERKTYRPPKRVAEELDKPLGSDFPPGKRRRSTRIQGLDAPCVADIETIVGCKDEEDDSDYGKRTPRVLANRPKFYGSVPDVEVGTWWAMRLECSAAGIHRPTVAGIHGGEEGCYSLALSGGYEDDIDMGECFTYTGEGGRDLKGTKANPKNLRTAVQSKDQTLVRGNLALSVSLETGNPIRVIRGFKLDSPFAPDEGYRYDGLYKVEKFWYTVGLSGFGVYKFALVRIADQAPPPWKFLDTQSLASSQDSGIGSDVANIDDALDKDGDNEVNDSSVKDRLKKDKVTAIKDEKPSPDKGHGEKGVAEKAHSESEKIKSDKEDGEKDHSEKIKNDKVNSEKDDLH